MRLCGWAAGLVLLGLAGAGYGAEQVAKEPVLEGAPLSQWLAEIGSDDFGRRERATEVLTAADSAIAPLVKAYLEKSEDLEVRRRLAAVLAAIAEVEFGGTFYQHDIRVTDGAGNPWGASNTHAEGTLEVARGKVVWVQKYDGETVTQTYSFDEKLPLKAKGALEVKLTFQKMDSTTDSYNPDDANTSLTVRSTPQGVQVVLKATDRNRATATVVFGVEKPAPKPAPVEEPAEDPEGGVEEGVIEEEILDGEVEVDELEPQVIEVEAVD